MRLPNGMLCLICVAFRYAHFAMLFISCYELQSHLKEAKLMCFRHTDVCQVTATNGRNYCWLADRFVCDHTPIYSAEVYCG